MNIIWYSSLHNTSSAPVTGSSMEFIADHVHIIIAADLVTLS